MQYILFGCAPAPVLAGVSVLLAAPFVLAESLSQLPAGQEPGNERSRRLEEVVVVAHPLSGEGLSQASIVLVGAELERKLAPNIGETLAREPGIHSAQFGNAVGRPVIHGLGGPRVRIMEDRIDTLDVSVTSADHAVAVEPFIAERIEVLKGSSALLYGSGAIGGVVDVHTGRIPHEVPQEFNGGVETRFDDNTNGTSTALKLNGGVGALAWHLDGAWKDGDDYQIPGFAESAQVRAMTPLADRSQASGELAGSEFDSESLAAGLSYIGQWGFVGGAVSELDASYGLPGAVEPGNDATPRLNMRQTRFDFELGMTSSLAALESINVRLGINDYEHQEIEPDGELASDFSNEAWELRVEAVYAVTDWTGAFGVQHTNREFSVVGEEAFVPPVDTKDTGLFWVGQREFQSFGGWQLETGLRIGQVEHKLSVGNNRTFTTWAASLGAVVPISDQLGFGIVADYSSRAPVAEELYSNGPHLVTGTFELGDETLNNERAAGLSATLRYDTERLTATATGYYNRFSNFIFEQATGSILDGLPVFQFQAEDARFIGLDLSASWHIFQWEGGHAEVTGLFDVVSAELDIRGNDNLPRIPPRRYGLGVLTEFGRLSLSVDYLRVKAQRDVTDRELASAGYDDLRAYVGFEVPLGRSTVGVFLSGKNLTNDEQRKHTSFIKDLAPAPGRTLELGARLLF